MAAAVAVPYLFFGRGSSVSGLCSFVIPKPTVCRFLVGQVFFEKEDFD